MSLTQLVASIVEEDGSGTVDTVFPQCPGYTRTQVANALRNAVTDGLLGMSGTVDGPLKGQKFTVYVPMPDLPDTPPPRQKSRFPRVASVFELAGAMA